MSSRPTSWIRPSLPAASRKPGVKPPRIESALEIGLADGHGKLHALE